MYPDVLLKGCQLLVSRASPPPIFMAVMSSVKQSSGWLQPPVCSCPWGAWAQVSIDMVMMVPVHVHDGKRRWQCLSDGSVREWWWCWGTCWLHEYFLWERVEEVSRFREDKTTEHRSYVGPNIGFGCVTELIYDIEIILQDCMMYTCHGFFEVWQNHRFLLWWLDKKGDVMRLREISYLNLLQFKLKKLPLK